MTYQTVISVISKDDRFTCPKCGAGSEPVTGEEVDGIHLRRCVNRECLHRHLAECECEDDAEGGFVNSVMKKLLKLKETER
jgi:hypothetical protein